mgnify:CR=1 FL=1
MPKPNLFIVGAPKCGTTSLYAWLMAHPDVFMCTPKEPNYFGSDLHRQYARSLADYEALFEGCGRASVLGEASTHYLYSARAIPEAFDYNPEAKFIACIRNPVDLVMSFHSHLYNIGVETEPDLWTAWSLRASRLDGGTGHSRADTVNTLQYGRIAALGRQLDRFFQNVPKHRRLVVVLDDLLRAPHQTYKEVLRFLDLPDHDRATLIPQNVRVSTRSVVLARTIQGLGRMKRNVGMPGGLGVLETLKRFNRRCGDDAVRASPAVRRELSAAFAGEIEWVAQLLERDVRHWITENAAAAQRD